MKIEKSALYERLMIFFAALVQLVGFYISITIEDYTHSFLPYCTIIVPAVNISCAAICLVLVFFYKIRFMQSVVLFIQGITMTLNNLMFLGLYLYFFGIALLFCNGYFKTDIRKKSYHLPGSSVFVVVCNPSCQPFKIFYGSGVFIVSNFCFFSHL